MFARGAAVVKYIAPHKWNLNSCPNLVSPSEDKRVQGQVSVILCGSNAICIPTCLSLTSQTMMLEHSSLPQINNLVSTAQPFGLSLEEFGFSHVPFDGTLGLSYPSFSTPEITPIFDNLEEQGIISEPVFAFYLST